MDTPASRPIRFFHRGRTVEVEGVAPTTSVLDWLREHARCSGTKEGCNEGDCGACTVVVGRLALDGDAQAVGGVELQAVNACTQFLPTLDGKALFTVEDVAAADGTLHPVQQSMVECHGSQCGFCTPGFIMSMWAAYERSSECGTRPTRREMGDELSGNLCRCTGYRPILDAGQRMFELPVQRLATAPVREALAQIAPRETFAYAAPNAQLPGAPRHEYFAPRTADELAALVNRRRDARLLAGSTDIGLWITKQFKVLPALIYLGDVAELRRIEQRSDGTLAIGAGASLEQAWQALAQRHPTLREVGLRFASPPVRRAGTMGGNVANGSPIGDSAPALLALDAQLVLRQGAKTRRIALADFYLDYMKNALQPGEFVQAIELPPPVQGLEVRSYKLSKRYDCDISALCTGFAIALDGASDQARVREVRLAYGGMAATVKRAAAAEAAIAGQPWSEATLRAAQAALQRDFKPLTDMRASDAYRMTTARNLLERFWLETRPANRLDAAATTVWAAA
jgi:xanthine dehydrogenase small subunit